MLRSATKVTFGILISLALVVAAGVLWPTSSAPLPDHHHDYRISNVHVIDVQTGTASDLVTVTVRNGVIAAIGKPGGEAAAVIDGRGGYLLPGFWDMHMHSFQLSPQLHLPLFVANGITGARDMMDCPGEDDSLIACLTEKRRWNAEAEAGRLASPRFISVASYYFENPALTPAETVQRARAYTRRGVDELKVYNRLSGPAYLQVAEEARRAKVRLVGHLPKAIALPDALAAGQRSFEHAHLFPRHCFPNAAEWRSGKLDAADRSRVAAMMVVKHDPGLCRDAFAAMKAAGAWFVPTHVTREEDARAGDSSFINDSRLRYLDPLSRWAYRDDLASTRSAYPGREGGQALADYFDHGLRLTGAAHRSGVHILVGTDTAIGGFRYHDELALLVRAGLTPAQVLRAATIDAARYAGLDDRFGSVGIGKQADLVLLSADPLKDISNTRRIQSVFIGGRLYDRSRLDLLLAFTERQANRPDNWIKLLWGFAWSSVASDL